MINYTVDIIKRKNGDIEYIPSFSKQEYLILEIFLTSEVRSFKTDIIDALTKASDGTSFGGNCCFLDINEGMATVEAQFGDAMGDPVTLPVDELIDIINRWCEDIKDLPKRAEE